MRGKFVAVVLLAMGLVLFAFHGAAIAVVSDHPASAEQAIASYQEALDKCVRCDYAGALPQLEGLNRLENVSPELRDDVLALMILCYGAEGKDKQTSDALSRLVANTGGEWPKAFDRLKEELHYAPLVAYSTALCRLAAKELRVTNRMDGPSAWGRAKCNINIARAVFMLVNEDLEGKGDKEFFWRAARLEMQVKPGRGTDTTGPRTELLAVEDSLLSMISLLGEKDRPEVAVLILEGLRSLQGTESGVGADCWNQASVEAARMTRAALSVSPDRMLPLAKRLVDIGMPQGEDLVPDWVLELKKDMARQYASDSDAEDEAFKPAQDYYREIIAMLDGKRIKDLSEPERVIELVQAHLEFGKLLIRHGNMSGARLELERGQQLAGERGTNLPDALRKDFFKSLGDLYISLGEPMKAKSAYQDGGLPEERIADAAINYDLAKTRIDQAKNASDHEVATSFYLEALGFLKKAMELDKGKFEYPMRAAEIAFKLEDGRECVRCCDDARRRAKNAANPGGEEEALLLKAQYYWEQGDNLPESIKVYREILSLNEKCLKAYYYLAMIYDVMAQDGSRSSSQRKISEDDALKYSDFFVRTGAQEGSSGPEYEAALKAIQVLQARYRQGSEQ